MAGEGVGHPFSYSSLMTLRAWDDGGGEEGTPSMGTGGYLHMKGGILISEISFCDSSPCFVRDGLTSAGRAGRCLVVTCLLSWFPVQLQRWHLCGWSELVQMRVRSRVCWTRLPDQ